MYFKGDMKDHKAQNRLQGNGLPVVLMQGNQPLVWIRVW
jgi:hypothetical protein